MCLCCAGCCSARSRRVRAARPPRATARPRRPRRPPPPATRCPSAIRSWPPTQLPPLWYSYSFSYSCDSLCTCASARSILNALHDHLLYMYEYILVLYPYMTSGVLLLYCVQILFNVRIRMHVLVSLQDMLEKLRMYPSLCSQILDLCEGNHRMSVRRNRPDTLEVQLMRSQQRHLTAQREVFVFLIVVFNAWNCYMCELTNSNKSRV